MTELRSRPTAYTAEAHMCAFGMLSKDKHRPGYAKKPTRFLTNSITSAKTLSNKCFLATTGTFTSWREEPGRRLHTLRSSVGPCVGWP